MTIQLPRGTITRVVRARLSRLAGQRGQSAAELLSVIGVFVILLGNAVPSFSRMFSTYALQGASRRVFADLQKARTTAVTENHRYVFRFVDSHTYAIHNDVNSNGTIDAGEAVTTVDLQRDWSGVTIASTGSLTLLPDATALASRTMTLTNRNGTARTVTVNAAGYIRLS
jgi:Tfp pilus assembly protein FimT